jgi:ketosteroid isomerase-like protein
MRRLPALVFCFFVLLATGSAGDSTSMKLVKDYLLARNASMEHGATPADVERVLAYYADDYIYEHPRFQARVSGKANVRQGMLSHLKETRNPHLTVSRIVGNDQAVVVEMNITAEAVDGNGKWKPFQRGGISVFEVRNGKIARIIDYH